MKELFKTLFKIDGKSKIRKVVDRFSSMIDELNDSINDCLNQKANKKEEILHLTKEIEIIEDHIAVAEKVAENLKNILEK